MTAVAEKVDYQAVAHKKWEDYAKSCTVPETLKEQEKRFRDYADDSIVKFWVKRNEADGVPADVRARWEERHGSIKEKKCQS